MSTTVRALLDTARAALAAAGKEPAALEARLLVSRACGLSHEQLIMGLDQEPAAAAQGELKVLLARRLAGEPVSRLIGAREFWSLPIKITDAVLDPRADSETLIEAALGKIDDRDKPLRIVDLGTGSGCLLLALLSELPNALGTGVDKSEAACQVAQDNAATLGLAKRARIICGDWTSQLAGQSFDLVISNPPYIPSAEIDHLAPEVKDHDPHLALDGGPDGLGCFRAIIAQLPQITSRGSLVVLETGVGQASVVSRWLGGAGFSDIEVVPDLAGVDRCVVAVRT